MILCLALELEKCLSCQEESSHLNLKMEVVVTIQFDFGQSMRDGIRTFCWAPGLMHEPGTVLCFNTGLHLIIYIY